MTKSLSEVDEATLRELTDEGGPLTARWCARCDHHYRFCKCSEPYWKLRWEGKLVPLPGEQGGPTAMSERITGDRENWPDWNGPKATA